MKLILTLAILLFSINLFARDFDQIKKEGTLKVAVDTTYPPMEFEDIDGKIIGLDVDLAKALAENLKVKIEFIVMPWDGILAGLQSNRYDIIMSSMNITPERSREVHFVPYMQMGQVFVVKKNAPLVKSEKDLAGKIVAVQADTTSYSALEAYQKQGIKIQEIKAFKGATDAFSALKSNQAQVILIDEAVGFYYAGLDAKTFLISGTALKPEPIGIAVKKSDSKLLKALETSLANIKKDGQYKSIYKKWLKTDPK